MSKGRKVLYWVITGIILSIAVSSMILTRNGSLSQFYDDGYVKNLKESWYTNAFSMNQGDDKKNLHLNSGTTGECCFVFWVRDMEMKEEKVNYLLLEVSHWSGAPAEWTLSYQDSAGVPIYEETFGLQEGEVCIPIADIAYNRIQIILKSESECFYRLENMKLVEYTELLSGSEWLLGSLLCFMGYVLISALIKILWRKNKKERLYNRENRKFGHFCGEQADIVLNWLNHPKSGEAHASKIRIGLLLLFVINGRIVHYNYEYGYAVIISIILLLAIVAWIPIESTTETMNHIVWKVWLVMCAIQFLSNLFLPKEFGYAEFMEVWMVVCFGLLYRAWSRMKHPERLIDDLCSVFEILIFLNIIYCLFGDAWRNISGRITGTRWNPSTFALGVTVCLAFMFFVLYQYLKQKKRWYYFLKPCIGIGACMWMLINAESRTALIIGMIQTVVFVNFVGNYLLRNCSRRVKHCVVILIVLILIIGVALMLKNNIIFSTRSFRAYSLDAISSGRIFIWKAYLGKVNFLGNINNLTFGSGELSAHNGIIMMLYRYGVFAGIIKIIFLIEVLCTIIRIWKKAPRSEYVLWAIELFVAYFISAMLDTCDEGIIGWTAWICFYFVVGYIVQEHRLETWSNDGK